ncbi:STAS domain-containing protein [Algoriphagus machipongonensis]|uniref:Anti-sigma factor antagonist n=1 Tax=Algoriphagus machipongonensis TaxID=388413 RepID=A3HY04_9BACT|nr:STAS domain-containing protein [Algoriphagus machipongonensis]EAZ81477.1 anti-anti-sigma factor [Algoriphagus machipongonensis]
MLNIEKQKEANHDILLLKGEIDASNSMVLDEAMQELLTGGSKSILVDGSELEYISSAGLGVFMSYLEDFQEEEVQLKIYSLTPRVMEVFKILGLDQLITIYNNKEEALEA